MIKIPWYFVLSISQVFTPPPYFYYIPLISWLSNPVLHLDSDGSTRSHQIKPLELIWRNSEGRWNEQNTLHVK